MANNGHFTDYQRIDHVIYYTSTLKKNSMDTASFKTIRNIQKEEMKKNLKEQIMSADVETGRQKREWVLFFLQAKKASRWKKRNINAEKRNKNWLELYYK